MSCRVYLYCTNFEGMPSEEETDSFFEASGTEYEAKTGIPLFWLCLFTSADIKLVPGGRNYIPDSDEEESIDEDFDEAGLTIADDDDSHRPYAYVSCLRTVAIDQLKQRSGVVGAALGSERHGLYLDWIARLEAEPFGNVLVKTEEIDGMGSDGELEALLRSAMQDLEAAMQTGALTASSDMNNMMGLPEGSILSACESYELAGWANSAQRWPPRLSPAQPGPEKIPASQVKKKSSWMFWRR